MAKILLTEPAEYDLLDTEYYISVDLCNPTAAIRIIDGIINTIVGLETFPGQHPFVNDCLLESLGIRMTEFDNYNIFYYFNYQMNEVHILRILYNRADWQNILKG